MDSIKINCRKVYEASVFYQKKMEELIDIHKELINISKEINENWKGKDANNYIASLNTQINEIPEMIEFLYDNSVELKNNAIKHNQIDSDFSENMERRSELDGYNGRYLY